MRIAQERSSFVAALAVIMVVCVFTVRTGGSHSSSLVSTSRQVKAGLLLFVRLAERAVLRDDYDNILSISLDVNRFRASVMVTHN